MKEKRINYNYEIQIQFISAAQPMIKKLHRYSSIVIIDYLDCANEKLSTMQNFSMSRTDANHRY